MRTGILGFARAAALATVLAAGVAAAAPRERLYVQNTHSRDITVIDAHSFEQVATIPVGDFTDDVAVSPDGRVLYANAQITGGSPFGWGANEAGKLLAFSTADHRLLWQTAVPGSPHHLSVSPDGQYIYVPLNQRHHILKVRASDGQLVQRWHSFMGNHGTKATKDGALLWVGNLVTDSLAAYDTNTGEIRRIFNTSDGVRPFAFSPDGARVYYQLSRLHGFEVRDMETGDLIRRVELPAPSQDAQLPESYPHTYNHGLEITPDGRLLIANGSIDDFVAVYTLPDLKLVAKIPVGDDPNWVSVRSDGAVAFVSNRGSNDVSVIDLKGFRELRRIPAGQLPQRMTVAPIAD